MSAFRVESNAMSGYSTRSGELIASLRFAHTGVGSRYCVSSGSDSGPAAGPAGPGCSTDGTVRTFGRTSIAEPETTAMVARTIKPEMSMVPHGETTWWGPGTGFVTTDFPSSAMDAQIRYWKRRD